MTDFLDALRAHLEGAEHTPPPDATLTWDHIRAMYDEMQAQPPPPKLIEEASEGLLRNFLARHGHTAASSPLWTPSSSLLGVPVAVNQDLALGTIRVTHADGRTDALSVEHYYRGSEPQS